MRDTESTDMRQMASGRWPDREIRCHVTAEDVVASSMAIYEADPAFQQAAKAYRRSLWMWMLVVLLGLVLPYVLWRIANGVSRQSFFDSIMIMAQIILLGGVGKQLVTDGYFAQMRRSLEKQRAAGELEKLSGEYAFTLTEDGIFVQSASYDWRMSWRLVREVVETPLGIVILLSSMVGILVPIRAFSNDAPHRDFVADCRDRMARHAERPHEVSMEARLASAGGLCPQCEYDLRGLTGKACPECGWEIVVERIMPYEWRAG